jgi:hypothetical protein
VLPGGQRINIPSDLVQLPALSASAPRQKRNRHRSRTARAASKKITHGSGTNQQHGN